MRTRTGRFILLAVLLIVGSSAAAFTASLARQIDSLGKSGEALGARVDSLLLTIQKIGEAQLIYVIPKASDRVATEPVASLIARVLTETADIERQVRSTQSMESLKTLGESGRALEDFETRVQEHVRLGQELMAADLVSVEARDALATMAGALREVRSAEAAVIEADRSNMLRQAWTVVGGAAAVWLLGLLALVGIPRTPVVAPAATAAPAILSLEDRHTIAIPDSPPSINLARAADVCTAVSRISDARDLTSLLSQTAAVLGASSVVVWMSAGDELIAASAHGYDSVALSRLGPIHRAALNATAAAWRLGRLQVVDGRDGGPGAVVTPMLGTDRCVGVVAVEVSNGRETDGTTQAVTRFVAAQLAATLAPWPASSAADSHIAPLEKAAEA
jgi:hypothetical protein